LHIVENESVNPEALEIFQKDFQNSLTPADKLHENYSNGSLDIPSHVMFDALYTLDGEFVACTGIYRRPQWPAGAYRLLNRTFFSHRFRNSHHFGFYASDYLVPGQVQNCKSDLKFTFVSRQGKNGGNFLAKLQTRPFFKNDYRVSDMFIQVVPGGLSINCFQKILYHNTSAEKFVFTGVSHLDELSKITEVKL
jgi:hypothetical protein